MKRNSAIGTKVPPDGAQRQRPANRSGRRAEVGYVERQATEETCVSTQRSAIARTIPSTNKANTTNETHSPRRETRAGSEGREYGGDATRGQKSTPGPTDGGGVGGERSSGSSEYASGGKDGSGGRGALSHDAAPQAGGNRMPAVVGDGCSETGKVFPSG